ncbi:MAG: hypothetical protein ACI4SW_02375 [Thermoguttaceae bacterium]
MKKFFALTLALVCAAGLSLGCKPASTDAPAAPEADATATEAPAADAAAPAAAEAPAADAAAPAAAEAPAADAVEVPAE